MSNEKLGAIVESDGRAYKRRLPGINLPSDFMNEEEIESLSSEVTTYFIEVEK